MSKVAYSVDQETQRRADLRSKLLYLAVPAAVVLLTGPLWLPGYWVRVFSTVFMFAVLTQSVNIITGYAGYPALGNVVFFGLGAYTTGVLMVRVGLSFWLALLAAGLVAALYAMLLGVPILRTKGHYFVMATLGVAEATREIVLNMEHLTGGGSGLTLPFLQMGPQAYGAFFFYLMLGLAVACTIHTYIISRNRMGLALRALKANEDAAAVMGINTTYYKIAAWAISAFYAGLAGGAYAYYMTYIDAGDVFNIMIVIQYMVMLLLGGMGTVAGPLIGAVIIEVLGQVVWGQLPELHLGALGILVVLSVLFVPRGIMDALSRRWSVAALLGIKR